MSNEMRALARELARNPRNGGYECSLEDARELAKAFRSLGYAARMHRVAKEGFRLVTWRPRLQPRSRRLERTFGALLRRAGLPA